MCDFLLVFDSNDHKIVVFLHLFLQNIRNQKLLPALLCHLLSFAWVHKLLWITHATCGAACTSNCITSCLAHNIDMTPSRHSSHDLPSMTCNGDDQQMAYVFVSLQRPVSRLTVEFMPDLYIAELYRLQQIQNSLARAVVKAPNISLPFSNLSTGLRSTNALNINFFLLPTKFLQPVNLAILTIWSLFNPLAVPAPHRLSPFLAH